MTTAHRIGNLAGQPARLPCGGLAAVPLLLLALLPVRMTQAQKVAHNGAPDNIEVAQSNPAWRR
jgi:hypothetical protein